MEHLETYLRELCLLPGLSGHEQPVCRYMARHFEDNGFEVRTDALGNCMAKIEGTDPGAPVVMIFAHMDSLGFIVRCIEDDGFIRLERLGGIPEKALPATEIQIGTRDGRWLDGVMPVIWVILAVLAVFAIAFAASGSFRGKILSGWRKNHGDKGVSRKLNTARLAQAIAMGMASGLPPEEAVSLAAGLMEDIPGARQRCEDCTARVENGEALGVAMNASGLLPAGQCRLLELGQRSGAGDSAMEAIARDLTEEGEAALESLVSRVEPALVLVCSVLVGLILLSVMLPLMHIMSAIG